MYQFPSLFSFKVHFEKDNLSSNSSSPKRLLETAEEEPINVKVYEFRT